MGSLSTHFHDIGFGQAAFTWSKEAASKIISAPSFRLVVEDDVIFKKNSINLIIGPTGAGKTSLLMALLGEMHYMPAGTDSWCNLPRKHGIAYASQESWVLSTTIRASSFPPLTEGVSDVCSSPTSFLGPSTMKCDTAKVT
jgi:ABC-type uncharacterized transport system fused permease/ATPase subunit